MVLLEGHSMLLTGYLEYWVIQGIKDQLDMVFVYFYADFQLSSIILGILGHS